MAQLANFGYNVNASFPDDPVAVVSRLVPVKLEKSGEELFVDQFGDDWYLKYGLFSDLTLGLSGSNRGIAIRIDCKVGFDIAQSHEF